MKFCGAIAATFLLTSCATIIRGTHDKLSVQSEPTGANVALSTGERGVTPVTFTKKRTERFVVTISKSGYQPQSVMVESRFSASGGAAVLGNALVGGVVGAIVDGSTGATRSLYPNPVSVSLVPNGKRVPTKNSLPSRAASNRTVIQTRTALSTLSAPTPGPNPKVPAPRFRTDKYGTQYLDSGR